MSHLRNPLSSKRAVQPPGNLLSCLPKLLCQARSAVTRGLCAAKVEEKMAEFLTISRLHIQYLNCHTEKYIFSHCFEELHPISPDEALSYDPSPLQSVLSKTLYFAFHLHSDESRATFWLAAMWSFWHTFRLNDCSRSWHLRCKWGNSFHVLAEKSRH